MVLQLWPSLSSLPLFTVIIHCTTSKPLYRSASMDCWMEALNCKLFTCLFLILHKHGLGHHRWSGNFILYCLGRVVVFLSHESKYLLPWLGHVNDFVDTGNYYMQFWFKASQQCRHHWIWIPLVWQAGEATPAPRGKEAWEMAMQVWFQWFTTGFGEVVTPPEGRTLFLFSAVKNALSTEMFPLEREKAGLAFWTIDVVKSLFACFAVPGSLLPQTIACIASTQRQLW